MSNTAAYTDSFFQYSIQEGDTVLESAVQYLSAACIAHWLQQRPGAKATLTMSDGERIDLPVYALRRRNAVVADLPDAPSSILA